VAVLVDDGQPDGAQPVFPYLGGHHLRGCGLLGRIQAVPRNESGLANPRGHG
jgi:hypothetical protein